MTSGNNFAITMEGSHGMFMQELTNTWYHEHTSSEGFVNDMKVLRSELGKMVKKGRVMVTISKYDKITYNRTSISRYVFTDWTCDELFSLEVRPYNGYDFSNVKELNFTTFAELLKYVVNDIKKHGLSTLDEIPVDTSWYSLELQTR